MALLGFLTSVEPANDGKHPARSDIKHCGQAVIIIFTHSFLLSACKINKKTEIEQTIPFFFYLTLRLRPIQSGYGESGEDRKGLPPVPHNLLTAPRRLFHQTICCELFMENRAKILEKVPLPEILYNYCSFLNEVGTALNLFENSLSDST